MIDATRRDAQPPQVLAREDGADMLQSSLVLVETLPHEPRVIGGAQQQSRFFAGSIQTAHDLTRPRAIVLQHRYAAGQPVNL